MEINHVKGSLLKSYFHSLAGVFHRKGALRVKNVQELKSRVYMMISQKWQGVFGDGYIDVLDLPIYNEFSPPKLRSLSFTGSRAASGPPLPLSVLVSAPNKDSTENKHIECTCVTKRYQQNCLHKQTKNTYKVSQLFFERRNFVMVRGRR